MAPIVVIANRSILMWPSMVVVGGMAPMAALNALNHSNGATMANIPRVTGDGGLHGLHLSIQGIPMNAM